MTTRLHCNALFRMVKATQLRTATFLCAVDKALEIDVLEANDRTYGKLSI